MLAPGRDRTRRGNGAVAEQTRNGAASRFEVLERVGQSTLWIVYRAKERATGQALALKALKSAFNRHPKFVESLFENSEQLLELSHPNVAKLMEIGREEGTLYQAVEWLPGGSLETRLLRAPLARDEILDTITPVAEGLAYLHGAGVVHGDLRPRQILSDGHGTWKISDLGVSQAFAAAGMATADAQPEAAYYLAPERTMGAAPSAASDVYSLGVVLYRMLTGRVPFDGPSPLAIALRHRSDAPLTPSQLNPKCDAELSALALRLLDKQPENRPQAHEVLRMFVPAGGRRVAAPAQAAAIAAPAVASPTAPAPVTPDPVVRQKRRQPPALAPDVDDTTPAAPVDLKTVKKRHTQREFWGMLFAFCFLLLACAAFGGLFVGAYRFWVRDTPPEVQVPNYYNVTQEEAQRILLKKGLTIRAAREIYDPKKPEGTVVNGEPPPGKWVRARREVVVTVSRGEKAVKMEDFAGLTLDQARKIIIKNGMRLGQIVEQFDKAPKNFICGQYPEAGQPFRRREPITLVVSRGPQPSGEEQDLNGGDQSAASTPGFSTTPIDPAAPPTDSVTLVRKRKTIRVKVPSGGSSEIVRIVVRENSGERTVYEKRHTAGTTVARTIRVTRPENSPATVLIYIGDDLVEQETL